MILYLLFREFGEKMTMYWRVLKDFGEIEMVLKVRVSREVIISSLERGGWGA